MKSNSRYNYILKKALKPIHLLEYLVNSNITLLKRIILYSKFGRFGKNVKINPRGTFHWPEKNVYRK